MDVHGGKRINLTLCGIILTLLLTGCQAVHTGAPHPFTTLFRTNEFLESSEPVSQANPFIAAEEASTAMTESEVF